ncbi:insulin-like growth factor binding protein [Cyathus striatus]|nr:insulin-like growth factor binding protein [Cyathus striatus]
MIVSCIFTIVPFIASVVAQSSPSVVCIAGQCLQGYSNVTIGATLSAPGQTSLHLLPGQYTSTTNPQLLHTLLTSSSASLSPSAGFNASLSTLPLNLVLSPGLSIFSDAGYSGDSSFTELPTSPNTSLSTSLSAKSIALAENVYASISLGSNTTLVLYDSVPDISQLPISSSFTLTSLQSTTCSPACSGSGICSSGTCVCPPGFTGSSCESCASGFFGSTCQACPSDCAQCDEGINGTGRCLKANITGAPETCGCENGVCNSSGQCTCNAGFVASGNGTACSKCSDGFFLTSTGDCKVCQLGCTKCADTTGTCISCAQGFTQDTSDRTKCDAVATSTSTGILCPDGSFADGIKCSLCAGACKTCKGGTSNDCTLCASGSYMFNGVCVSTNDQGVCEGSGGFVADNVKHVCDTCGAKCTSCGIPSFDAASTINDLKCTGCLPGSFLSNGQCVDSCPSGTFVDPKDNMTCTACDSSCSTCSGSATFCLTCASSSQVATPSGQCASTCPSNSFTPSSSKTCQSCHPDCASCSGPGFNQCSTCPSDRPVLSNGRCMPAASCGKGQYFDSTAGCKSCDSSCASCSGSSANQCLSCSSDSQILQSGSCVDAKCTSGNVVSGLGICLSTLVIVPKADGTGTTQALPTITGISDPTVITSPKAKLQWWEILLMALGCAFIFVAVLFCLRRRAKKRRMEQTRQFAQAKRIGGHGWKWRLVRFGEKLFGHKRSPKGGAVYLHTQGVERERPSFYRYRDEEDLERGKALDVVDSYDHKSRKGTSYAPSSLPSLDDRLDVPRNANVRTREQRLSDHSMFSEITGKQRNTPEPRQPVKGGVGVVAPVPVNITGSSSRSTLLERLQKQLKEEQEQLKQQQQHIEQLQLQEQQKGQEQQKSRFSESTFSLSAYTRPQSTPLVDLDDTPPPPVPKMPSMPTEAERIVMAVRPGLLAGVQQQQLQTGMGMGVAAAPPATFNSFLTPNYTGVQSGTGISAPIGSTTPQVNFTGMSAPAAATQGTGSYWMQPVQPSATGASAGSRNPFRQ